MKSLLVSILLLTTFNLFGQNLCKTKESNEFIRELQSFIDSIKPKNRGGKEYEVYVANIYYVNSKNKEICFTLGYILNEFNVKHINPNYVFYYKDEIVLIKINSDNFPLDNLPFKKIEKEDTLKINNKLYPTQNGGFTYTSEGLMYCKKNKQTDRVFYENSDEIPLEKSIWGNFPSGVIIERVDSIK